MGCEGTVVKCSRFPDTAQLSDCKLGTFGSGVTRKVDERQSMTDP